MNRQSVHPDKLLYRVCESQNHVKRLRSKWEQTDGSLGLLMWGCVRYSSLVSVFPAVGLLLCGEAASSSDEGSGVFTSAKRYRQQDVS